MDELVRWLGEQLDEDERIAREADPELNSLTGCIEIEYLEIKADEVHALRHGPARVLREIDAKRGVVARYEFACKEAAALGISEEERETRVQVGGALQACVVVLATVYADRPGYAEAIASAE